MFSLLKISDFVFLGLLWSKQFYHYIIEAWLEGDPEGMTPPAERYNGRNASGDWAHLFNRDIISMPDKWEYPWVSSLVGGRWMKGAPHPHVVFLLDFLKSCDP